jgi:hypothetical protein
VPVGKAKSIATLQSAQTRFMRICSGLSEQLAATLNRNSHSLGSSASLARLSEHGDYMQERWFSVEEVMAQLGFHPDTIYKWITRQKMPTHKHKRPRR